MPLTAHKEYLHERLGNVKVKTEDVGVALPKINGGS